MDPQCVRLVEESLGRHLTAADWQDVTILLDIFEWDSVRWKGKGGTVEYLAAFNRWTEHNGIDMVVGEDDRLEIKETV